ncbi:ATP-binding protein [Nostoc sp. MBR 210]|nr:ATP-binding protein [Nostoc sp. MBR 210]
MYLQRIRVPDFRVLKDVDISFEKELTPSIFPLGSLNGGGKSTLLQLIFVLLHCSTHPDRVDFLKNIIEGFKIDKDSDKRVLAIIDIWNGHQSIELEFFTCKESFIKNLFVQEDFNHQDNEYFNIAFYTELKTVQSQRENLMKERQELKNGMYRKSKELEENQRKLEEISEKLENIKYFAKIFLESLRKNQIIHICDIINSDDINNEILLCSFNNLDINEATSFLSDLSNKVFLAAPISQIFLFLASNSRKSLFNTPDENDYYLELNKQKTRLTGFFTYDVLAIDVLIKSFIQARDQDFNQAIETGEYGNNYRALLNDLNSVLINKKINANKDLTGVNFRRYDDDVELYPEDLSHGELKKLCIYVWIKSNKIENAIVLMDEIEIAFHPDWQYQIVRDLEEWSPSNQYILATHSYELCQAVTPAHVKELPPKLIKPNKL